MIQEGLSFQVELLELLSEDRVFLASLLCYFLCFLGDGVHGQTLLKTWWLGEKRLEAAQPSFRDLAVLDLLGEDLLEFARTDVLECRQTFLRVVLVFCQTLHFESTFRLDILAALGNLAGVDFGGLLTEGLGDGLGVDFAFHLP